MKTPRPFQRVAIDRIAQGGLILADECGLGKTLQAIEGAIASRGEEVNWRTLVVCPNKVAAQWALEIEERDPDADIVHAGAAPYVFDRYAGWAIATYPNLFHALTYARLKSCLWDMIIFDEAHRLKNRKSNTFVRALGLISAKTVCLTGTPIEKTPQDLWTLLRLTSPADTLPFWTYVDEYLEKEPGFFERWIIKGPKDPKAFGEMLSQYMLRRTKEEVMPELPEKILVDTYVEPDSKQMAALTRMRTSDDVIVQVDDNVEMLVPNKLAQITRMQQLSTWPPLLDVNTTSGKIGWLTDFLFDHPDEPLVVFTRFPAVAKMLADRHKAACLTGSTDTRELFLSGETNLIFCTIEAIEGVDGLQIADIAIFLDSHWSTIRMTQAIDRIHRMNITKPKTIYRLYSCYEDELVLMALDQKWSEAELVYYYLHPGEGLSSS